MIRNNILLVEITTQVRCIKSAYLIIVDTFFKIVRGGRYQLGNEGTT